LSAWLLFQAAALCSALSRPNSRTARVVLKILHCIPSLQSGGAERQLSILAQAQVAMGSDVHLAHIHPGAHLSSLSTSGVQVHRINARTNHDPRVLGELVSLFDRTQPDVLHTWLPQMDIAAGGLALLKRIPWVLAERSCADAYSTRFRDRVARRYIGRWADAVVANSEGGQAIWQGELRRGAQTHIVRNVLALEEIAAARPETFEKFGLASGQPVVIFAGRLSSEKNLDLLLQVAIDVCAQSKAGFLICGNGLMRPHVDDTVQNSRFSGQIKVLGQRDDLWSLMKGSQVFVSTSAFEGQPNAVLEAMACGCPLVVSDIPAHREFLDADSADIVPMDKDRFVESILRALRRTPDVLARAAEARRRVQDHRAGAAASAYDLIYREVLRRYNRCVA
jgi:glycosyltransferase involved in cell wall biosynthesis